MTLTAANSPYTGSHVAIDSGVTVTVEPGVVVQTNSLTVNGTLDLDATAGNRAVFTSHSDSAAGQWSGITLNNGSSQLDHAEIRYADCGVTTYNNAAPTISNVFAHHHLWAAMCLNGGDPTITDNTIEDGAGVSFSGSGSPVISHNTISDCNGGGAIGHYLGWGSGEVRIHDNTVDNCGTSQWAAVGVGSANNASSTLTGITLADNTVTDSVGRAIDYDTNHADDVIPPDIDENVISGGAQNGIWVAGRIETSTTWQDAGFPMVLRSGSSNHIKVAASTTLTLAPGLVVKATESDWDLAGEVQGDLVADGTATDPIVFTSLKDDSVGGDTNGDGSATTPAAGDWNGISISGDATLDYVQARFGSGNGPQCCPWGGAPMFTFDGASPTITNSLFEDAKTVALQFSWGSPVVSGNTLERAGGIHFHGGGDPQIFANDISDCGQTAAISQTIPQNNSSEVRIHDNVIDGCGSDSQAAIRVNSDGNATGTDSVTGITLEGNTITGGAGRAIEYFTNEYDDTIPADIDENTLSGNASNAIWLSGKVDQSTTWQDRGYPFVPRKGSYYGDFTVAQGATLTLAPGVVIKPQHEDGLTRFRISGELVADGTAQDPVTFTSLKDDSVGGDTNADGNATSPAPGDWNGLSFDASRGTLDHVEMRYGAGHGPCGMCGGGGPVVSIYNGTNGAATTITNSSFEHALEGGIAVDGDWAPGTAPEITHNRFHDIQGGHAISKGGTQMLFAPYNIFDCITGPAPRGCGAAVGALVSITPWNSLTDLLGKCPGKKDKKDCPAVGDPVSVITGAFTYEHSDLSLSNQGDRPLEFVRSYDSGNRVDAGLGPGWANSSIMLASELENGDVVVYNFDGRQDHYRKVAGVYIAPAGGHDELTKSGGEFTLTAQDRTVYDFDGTGRITLITDDHGLETDFDYDSNGRLASITDPAGQSLSFSYNGSNHITEVADSAGRDVSFTYTSAGDLETVTDALGGVTEYGYDGQGRLTTITDPREVTFLTNTYDAQDRVIEQEDGEGNLWTYDYAAGETSVTEPEGGEITYQFNPDYQITSVTDQLSHTTTYSYDGDGDLASVTEPGSAVTSYDYDGRGNLISVTDPESGERSYSYDSSNRLETFTDERLKTWSYTWDTNNDLTEIEDPDLETTSIAYNVEGQPTTITDANSHATTYGYDARGNLTSVEDPLSHTTSYGYNAYNQVISSTRSGLAPESYGRNALGDLLSITTPEGHQTTFDYDENGGLIEITDPALNEWQIERDAMEQVTAYVDPLLSRTEIAYDDNLNPVSVTDRRSETTTYEYDLANQLVEIDAPDTGAWQFGYDARGNRDEVTDPRNNVTIYAFDLADRLIAADEPLTPATTYDYDSAGNLESITDPKAHETSFTYDDLGRLSQIDQPLLKATTFDYDDAGNLIERVTAEDTLDLAYDNADRLTSISDGVTTLRLFAYDSADRLTGATDAQAKTLEFGYDDDGNLTSIDDDRGQTVSRIFDSRGNLISQTDGRGTLAYVYDALNRMTQLTDPQSDTLTFTYDHEGNPTTIDMPSGIETTNTFDGVGRMLSTTSEDSSNVVVQAFDYAYDAAGNRTSEIDRNSDQTTYSHDALNRLTEFDPPQAPAVGYVYDDAGNRIEAGTVTFNYNALNQMTGDSAGATYDYDGAGRLAEVTDGLTTTSYEWDALDQLVAVDNGSSPTTYSYDGLGRRSERASGGPTETAHYGDLGQSPILDTTASGTLRSFVFGSHGLVQQTTSTGTQHSLTDAHGDVTTMTDASGGLDSRRSWDPWGRQLSGTQTHFGWLGGYGIRSDPATGLSAMGIRQYVSSTGRFASEDPVFAIPGLGQSTNRYSYVMSNPLNRYDLSGRCDDVFAMVCEWWDDPLNFGDPTEMVAPAGDWWGEHIREVVKEINLSPGELVGNVTTLVVEEAACIRAAGAAAAVGTPAAGLAAAGVCGILNVVGAAGAVTDITDDDNSLWPDEVINP